ncbi:MAG: Kef family K(+) transporter [Rhodospirillales bacterium]|nr:Kef family K(+) transporter [Rhodospirillales bacterium]
MPHDSPLIATIVVGLLLAFVLGAIAQRLRISPLIGYLLAGVVVGPHTPGFVADQALANELAEIGVILLMFGVGLHFSLKDLLSVWTIAIPGAIAQIAVAIPLGAGVSWLLGWPLSAGFLFGLALSVASTVVLLRALQERRLIQTDRGRIAVGWLIVQDLSMIFVLVLLPAVAGLIGGTAHPGDTDSATSADVLIALAVAAGKMIAFIIAMLIVGRRIIPWILHYIAHTGSRELFRLAVLAIALGVAYGGAALFGVSFALGAFFAGMILSESELSQRAAEESLPLRDAFAVLFFVSVGMLFDPATLIRDPWPLVATLLIVMVGKSIPAFLIVRAFGHSNGTSLMISTSLAQIGEFSFILAGLGVSLQLLPDQGRVLILAAAILSIMLNPALLYMTERLRPLIDGPTTPAGPVPSDQPVTEEPLVPTALRDHAVLVGYGRVGSAIGDDLQRRKIPFLAIEAQPEIVDQARAGGVEAIVGNAADATLLKAANVAEARSLFVAIPDGFEAGQVVEQAKAIKSSLMIVARAHSDAEVAHLRQMGADSIVMGEREIALGMMEAAFAKGEEERASPPPGAAIP